MRRRRARWPACWRCSRRRTMRRRAAAASGISRCRPTPMTSRSRSPTTGAARRPSRRAQLAARRRQRCALSASRSPWWWRESAALAREAAERVAVHYEALPAVTDVRDAIAPDAPLVHDAAPRNLALDITIGRCGGRSRPPSRRRIIVVAHRFRSQRIVNAQMEPRGAIGLYDEASGLITVVSGNQSAVKLKTNPRRLPGRCARQNPRRHARRRWRFRAAHECRIPSRSWSRSRRAPSSVRSNGWATAPNAS